MLLQQAQERFTLQQEAVHVARELDQQQLFALLQQQQQAAAQEQVRSVGITLAVASM
jgi:response regulator of citrate/malate metabolism